MLTYDDGVYFGAAESFVFGRLPYRDFVLLHPPGIVLSLARLRSDGPVLQAERYDIFQPNGSAPRE